MLVQGDTDIKIKKYIFFSLYTVIVFYNVFIKRINKMKICFKYPFINSDIEIYKRKKRSIIILSSFLKFFIQKKYSCCMHTRGFTNKAIEYLIIFELN